MEKFVSEVKPVFTINFFMQQIGYVLGNSSGCDSVNPDLSTMTTGNAEI